MQETALYKQSEREKQKKGNMEKGKPMKEGQREKGKRKTGEKWEIGKCEKVGKGKK